MNEEKSMIDSSKKMLKDFLEDLRLQQKNDEGMIEYYKEKMEMHIHVCKRRDFAIQQIEDLIK